MGCAHKGQKLGYGTVVLQAGGETDLISGDWICELITRIKQETGQAITLSLGERKPEELRAWRRCGADRYLLRFETSNRDLFQRIHPPHWGGTPPPATVLALLKILSNSATQRVAACCSGYRGAKLQ